MPDPVSFKSIDAQLAEEMRRRIRTGVWADALPGIHRLTREFALGRPTVLKALALLEQSGDIVSGGNGRAMRPVRRDNATPLTGSLLAYHLPPDLRTGESPAILDALEAALPGPVHRVLLEKAEPPEVLASRLLESPARVIVTANMHAEVADLLAAAGRRVVALGGPGTPVRAPRVSVDHEALVREAFRRAFAAGHTRVSLIIWRRHPDVARRMREWIAAEYARAGLRHAPDFDAPILDDDTPGAVHDCLRQLFRHTPPTALVIHDFPQWVATVTTLCSLRRRVPEDVSTLLLTRTPEIAAATPTQAHFRHPVDAVVGAIRRLLRSPKPPKSPPQLRLAPIWVAGDSLNAPREHTALPKL